MVARRALSNVALIPAWNEASRLEAVLVRVVEQLPTLVVDDGSSDGTGDVAERCGATVVRHGANRGKGASLLTGFRWALDQGFEGVVTLDADGQHDPQEIPHFVDTQERTGADLVIGRRDFSQMPFPRSVSNPFGSWLLSLALGQRIYDNQCGFRLYRKSILMLAEQESVGFEFEVDVIADAVRAGLKLAWVDVATIYGTGKVSYFHPVRDSALFLAAVWRAWRRKSIARPVDGQPIG
jgi:glycosyltransferase involved in cell wall biosynthesis